MNAVYVNLGLAATCGGHQIKPVATPDVGGRVIDVRIGDAVSVEVGFSWVVRQAYVPSVGSLQPHAPPASIVLRGAVGSGPSRHGELPCREGAAEGIVAKALIPVLFRMASPGCYACCCGRIAVVVDLGEIVAFSG